MVLALTRAVFAVLAAEDTPRAARAPLRKAVIIFRIFFIEFASGVGSSEMTRNSGLSTTENVMCSTIMRPTSG